LYSTYGQLTANLIDQNQVDGFEVYIDDQNTNTESSRPYLGYAVEGMPSVALGDTLTGWNAYVNHPRGDAARWPAAGQLSPGRWRRLGDDEVGYVFYTLDGSRTVVLGFYLKQGRLGHDDVLAVAYVDPADPDRTIGASDDQDPTGYPAFRGRLVRHPDQEANYFAHPTSPYMMRHVYSLGARSITSLELDLVSQLPGKLLPGVPDNIPDPGSTYLHMFGLDEIDQDNRPIPDGVFDEFRANTWDAENGYLFLPGLRPFSPPDEVLLQRLASAIGDISNIDLNEVFPPSERVSSTLYTLPEGDAKIPSRTYRMDARVASGDREIILPQDIIEGSEIVQLDGRTLTAGVDYDIEPFAGGRISLKGRQSAAGPAERIASRCNGHHRIDPGNTGSSRCAGRSVHGPH
jgi:hypothetical protein